MSAPPAITYLDHGATTPLRPEVADAMAGVRAAALGNPTGSHPPAQRARRLLEEARDEVAALLGRGPGEIVFTSGGTEAANLAVLGTLAAASEAGAPASVLCSGVEHPAVWESCRAAARSGAAEWRTLAVDADGIVDLDQLPGALAQEVTLVAVMLANNETGALQPLSAVVEAVRRLRPAARVFTDAVQAAPYVDLSNIALEVDLMAISAHKVGGPVGVGALAVAPGVALVPTQHGGGQERERRSGTQDVVGAVGLATALRLAAAERASACRRVAARRDQLADGLSAAIPGAHRTVRPEVATLPGHLHLCFPGVEREELLVALGAEGVCASGGSSCASGALQPSRVLTAMGVPATLASGAIRFTLGHDTTAADVARAVAVVPPAVAALAHGGR